MPCEFLGEFRVIGAHPRTRGGCHASILRVGVWHKPSSNFENKYSSKLATSSTNSTNSFNLVSYSMTFFQIALIWKTRLFWSWWNWIQNWSLNSWTNNSQVIGVDVRSLRLSHQMAALLSISLVASFNLRLSSNSILVKVLEIFFN